MSDMVGRKFGRLTVIEDAGVRNKRRYWRCLCDCGNQVVTRGDGLVSGHAKSCGCRKKEFGIKHGFTRSEFYATWRQMHRRCYCADDVSYKRYGGRGVCVCDDWHDFEKFEAWANSRDDYEKGKTLDRIDVDGDYCPTNCRWASKKEQTRNRSTNILYKGESLATWAERLGIPYHIAYSRYRSLKWTIEEALGLKQRKSTRGAKAKMFYRDEPLATWARRQNLKYSVVYNRIVLYGWTVEEALGLLPRQKKRK